MKKISLIIMILLPIFIKAQQYVPFPDSNAIWNDRRIYTSGTEYTRYGLIGDTSLNLIQYHKLYKLNDTILNLSTATYYGAIREQAKKIYFRSSYCQNEILLYDFTKNVGDTIHSLHIELDLSSCDTNTNHLYSGIITSIDSILINGNYHKVFHFDQMAGWQPYWIEGIGSSLGLTYPSPIQFSTCSDCSWDLICFRQNNEVLYLNPNVNTCYPTITSIQKYTAIENTVSILPNPVTNISTIQWNNSYEHPYSMLTIIDVFGRTVKSYNVSVKNAITINKTDFSPGIYFVKLFVPNGKYYITKIIIQ